jgi:hypothetical protein
MRKTMCEAVACLRRRVIQGEVPGSVLLSLPLNWKPNRLISSRNSKRFPDASHIHFSRRKLIRIGPPIEANRLAGRLRAGFDSVREKGAADIDIRPNAGT